MSASLVGSEMCIRDRGCAPRLRCGHPRVRETLAEPKLLRRANECSFTTMNARSENGVLNIHGSS
eukprot:9309702-Alexandrium_andersonii.AAC.1